MSTPAGPGKFSQRTDKAVGNANASLPNADYGENKDYQEAKSAAPMAQDAGAVDVTGMDFGSLFGNAADQVTPLNAESTMPDVPVTDGADAGPGAGMEALSSTQRMGNNYTVAYLRALEFMANQPGSSDSARNLVRQLKSQM